MRCTSTSAIAGHGDECYGAVTDAKGKVMADPNRAVRNSFTCNLTWHLRNGSITGQPGDKQWLHANALAGAIAEFWASKATPSAGGYAINQVQTPDEYATDTDNDAYTNAAASLELEATIQAASILGKTVPKLVVDRRWSHQDDAGRCRTQYLS